MEKLAAPSGPRGATLFTMLPPGQTGLVVENKYADPRMWGDLNQEFKFGAIGTGVAVGDYDGDGRPDILVVSKVEGCRLFRNLGNWKFADVTEKAGLAGETGLWSQGLAQVRSWLGQSAEPVAWNQGATFADLNNDGWLDLYVCRFAAPNLLYINQGDGTFRESAHAWGLDVVSASNMAAFADYDRDGWLDLYLQTNLLDAATHPTGEPDRLFRNGRNGTFTEVTAAAGIAGPSQGHSATWWDYDADGWPDLYVANDFAVPDRLYHNNGDGTFTDRINEVVPHLPHSSMGADLGDVNNDGRIDFLVADMAATSHEKDQRGMANIRALLNEEMLPPGVSPQSLKNALFLNTGTGHMLEAAHLAGLSASDWTWAVRLEDFDNDGRVDVFFTNGMVRELHNVDLVRRSFAMENLEDGVRELKNSPVLAETNLAFRNRGNLHFEEVGAAWGLDQTGVSFGAATGDFDGDGDLDLIFTNYESGPTLLRNDSDGGHRVVISLRGSTSNRFGVGATVEIESASSRQVRSLVLARGYLSASEPILHFGLGEDRELAQLTVTWPGGAVQQFQNLAVDQRYVISEPAGSGANLKSEHAGATPTGGAGAMADYVERGAGLGLALDTAISKTRLPFGQPLAPLQLDRRGPELAIADLNGDGRADVVLGGTSAQPLRVALQQADGTFRIFLPEDGPRPGLLDDGPLLLADVNGDGAPDLIVSRSGTAVAAGSPEYQPRILLNDGTGALRAANPGLLPELHLNAGALAAADFDRDGRVDFFIGGRSQPGAYPLSPDNALVRNVGGRFEDVTDLLAPGLRKPGMVTAALWSDLDRDGWPDLLLALDWGTVKYFHNEAGRGFTDRSAAAGFAAAGAGHWSSLATADFNGDGRPDYVAGNFGLNTIYRASAEHPARIYHGDFAGNGVLLAVEALDEGGRLFPRATRKDLGARVPAVLKKFPRNDGYARATLAEILGADRLARAQALAITELASGVFLSQGDGTFRFVALPRLAQIAPLQGIVAGDFDGDGRADAYAVQNSFAPLPSIGRFDGGLSQLLLGDGRGGFVAVEPARSGLVVPGEAKRVVAADLDGDGTPEFVVSRNGAPLLVFQRSRPARNRPPNTFSEAVERLPR